MKMNIEIRGHFEVLLRSARESWILGYLMLLTRHEAVERQHYGRMSKPSWVSSPRSFDKIHALIRQCLCNQLNNTSGRLDLLLSLLAEVPSSHNKWDLWYSALAEDFGVA